MHIHIADIISFTLYATVLSLSVIALPESSETLYVEADGVEYAYSLSENGIKIYGGVCGDCDDAVKAFLKGELAFDPNVKCSHHEHGHNENHTCGEHGCGNHECKN